jgi:hypothetical protein
MVREDKRIKRSLEKGLEEDFRKALGGVRHL